MNKKVLFVIFDMLIIIGVAFTFFYIQGRNTIPQDYMFVFHGGNKDVRFETYIYKIDNGQNNYGFKYINVTSTPKSSNGEEWVSMVTRRGKVDWTDNVFDVASKNHADTFVSFRDNDKVYTFDEFLPMFLMN